MKRRISLFCVLLFLLTVIPSLPVHAAPPPKEYNTAVEEYQSALQDKYQILITYPMRSDGYTGIGTASLTTLDTTLEYISPSVIRQLSAFYQKETGKRLCFNFSYLPKDFQERDIAALGFFQSNISTIHLYIPSAGTNMIMSGCSPYAIAHEVGHAFHFFLSQRYGQKTLEESWSRFNGSIPFGVGNGINPDRNVFATYYASINLEEDFAETFAYAFASNRDGLGISQRFVRPDGTPTGLGEKMSFLKKQLLTYLSQTDQVETAFAKMYSAKPFAVYEGRRLSGNSLEYIGFNQPAGILGNVLKTLKIEPVTTYWIPEIGGWRVTDQNQGTYLVFPGCGYVTLSIPTRRSTK